MIVQLGAPVCELPWVRIICLSHADWVLWQPTLGFIHTGAKTQQCVLLREPTDWHLPSCGVIVTVCSSAACSMERCSFDGAAGCRYVVWGLGQTVWRCGTLLFLCVTGSIL